MEKHSFTILGAGIAGLGIAIALRDIGLEAEVYEAAPHLEFIGAGLSLAANGVKALRRLGVENDLRPYAYPLSYLAIYDHHGNPITRIGAHRLEAKHGTAQLAVHRAHLQMCLLARLDQQRIHTGKRVLEVIETGGGYEIRFADDTQAWTQYLIVTDGIHSVVRQQYWPDAAPRYAGYACWRGIADMHGLGIHEASEIWGPAGRVGMVPLINNRLYWFACINGAQHDACLRTFTREDLIGHFRKYTRLFTEIMARTPDHQIIHSDIMDIAPLSHFAKGHLLLAGDAAHATTPNLGQGACQALEDAVVLAECLQQNSLVAKAFSAFEQRRLPRTRRIIRQSRDLGKWSQLRNPLLCRVRNTVFRAVPRWVQENQLDWISTPDFEQRA